MKSITSTKKNHLLDTKTVWLNKFNLNIRYAELGEKTKPTMLLLHGVPENLHSWYATGRLLSEKYHVFAIDWPGFGGSDPLRSSNDYTSRNFTEVVIDFMDALEVQTAIIMATDIALLPALLVGLEYPKRVSKLIVMDGLPFPRPQYTSWELKSFAKKGSVIGKALIEWFPSISAQIAYLKGFYSGHSIPPEVRKEFLTDGKSKVTQEAFSSYFQNFHLEQKYFEQRAHQLETPVLVVWGKQDRFIKVDLAYEIAEKLPNAQLKIIDKTGHYVHMDAPQELVKAANSFLNAERIDSSINMKHRGMRQIQDIDYVQLKSR
ncbi:MAG: alpha/beta hydrolase [Flavobacteriaceae bacterium]